MKYLKLLIFLFAFNQLSAQEIGIISDPDGYTNIRSGKGTSYEIVGKIKEAEQFRYFPDTESNWWAVETIPYYGTPLKGFVHKSRIQSYNAESTNCNCPQPYNSEDAKPVLNAKVGNSNLTVCGFLKQRQSANSVKISEFTISNCETDEVLRFYGAVTTCQVSVKGEVLEIVELDRLPLGKNFKWIQTPFRKAILSDVAGTPTFSDAEFVLDLSNISNYDVKSFVDELPNYKGKGYFQEIETFIGKLLICSLKGNEQCEIVLNDIDNYLNFVLDGALAEFHNDCKSVLEQSKSR